LFGPSADQVSVDISGLVSLATSMSQQRTAVAANMLVLKKAMDQQQSTAATLLASVSSPDLPSHLGQNVNTIA
jgi:hypothetical protein